MIKLIKKFGPSCETAEKIGKWSSGLAKGAVALFLGMAIGWFIVNLNSGPGTIVTSTEEAEGPQFSDPATLDVVVKFHRDRVCPSTTQRWVWRWTEYRGKRVQQAIPLMATNTPFLADTGEVMLTLPNPGVPDLNDHWFYRTVTSEQCGFLPGWANSVFGSRIFRSPDEPVNFVGAPHGDKK